VTRDLSDRQLAVIHSPSRSQSHLQQASITGLCVHSFRWKTNREARPLWWLYRLYCVRVQL